MHGSRHAEDGEGRGDHDARGGIGAKSVKQHRLVA